MPMKAKTVVRVGVAGRQTVGAHDDDEAEIKMRSYCGGCGSCDEWRGSCGGSTRPRCPPPRPSPDHRPPTARPKLVVSVSQVGLFVIWSDAAVTEWIHGVVVAFVPVRRHSFRSIVLPCTICFCSMQDTSWEAMWYESCAAALIVTVPYLI